MAQEGTPRTKVTLDKQNRGLNKRSTVREDVSRSSTSIDKHCQNKVKRGVLKYLRGKLQQPH